MPKELFIQNATNKGSTGGYLGRSSRQVAEMLREEGTRTAGGSQTRELGGKRFKYGIEGKVDQVLNGV